MLLNGIDWAVIAAFFAMLALIPFVASLRSRRTANDFFTSGRSMPWWLIGFSMVAATTATDSANFFTEVIRRDGMSGNWVMWAFILTGLLTVFVIPLAVQWWNVWKAGSEPGGGGYIVQRMLTAKSDAHALGGTLFFNVLNWVIRPWSWYVVGLCSVLVYPGLASIQAAFPNVDPSLVQGDMAYPAMLTKVPNGWLGVVAASMMGALFSTVAAHLNLGSAYMVNDFWKRFVRPKASDRELIWIGRSSMLLLLLLGCLIAPHLKSAKGAFDLMLLS